MICHEAGDTRAGERRVGAALDEAKQGLVLVAAEARHDKVKHLECIMRADGIGNAVRHRIHMRERRADATVVRLVRQGLVRHGDLHEAEQAQMVQAVEVGEVLLATVHIGDLGLDLEALVARQVEVPQLGIRIPVPVVVPVGNVVLEHVVPHVDALEPLQQAQLRRQRLQPVPVQVEHAQLHKVLQVVARHGAELVPAQVQLPQLAERRKRAVRHLVDVVHAQVQHLELLEQREDREDLVGKPVVRHPQRHEAGAQRPRRAGGPRRGRCAVHLAVVRAVRAADRAAVAHRALAPRVGGARRHRERVQHVAAHIDRVELGAVPERQWQRAQVVVLRVEPVQVAEPTERVGQPVQHVARDREVL